MSAESEMIDELFGGGPMWKGKYRISYCDLCEVICIKCPNCKNVSCNGGGCSECLADWPEWRETKHCLENYLSEQEINTFRKLRQLRKFIPICLAAGFKEIDWKYLHENGSLCYNDYVRFEELKPFFDEAREKYFKNIKQ